MKLLVDLRVLMAYAFKEDPDHQHAEAFFDSVEKERIEIYVVSSIIFEAEALWLAGKVDVPLEDWLSFVSDIMTSPVLTRIEINETLYASHVKLYRKFGGEFTYFDSFHAAATTVTRYPLVTTDSKLLKATGIPTKDLRKYSVNLPTI